MAAEPFLGVEVDIPDDVAQALEVAMVIKGLDDNGNVSYWTVSTPNLMNVEIIGMMRWGEAVALIGGDDA